MILKGLRLKNFLIHDDTEVEFSQKGITVFIGENGAGKSSILEGLTFALFGKSDKGSHANLVKWGRKQAQVILDFQKGNNIYRIERTITTRGNRASSSGVVYLKKGNRFVPYYQKNITREIPKLTGITYKIFSSSILVKQGDIEGLLKLTPQVRGKVLEEILDMTLYQLLSEKAGEKRKTLQTKIEALETSLKDIETLKERKNILEDEITKIKKEKKTLEEKLKEKKKEEENLQKKIEELLKEKAQLESKKNQIEILKEQLKHIEEEIQKGEEQLKEIQEKERELPALEEDVKKMKELEDILKKFSRLESLEEKYSFIKEKLTDLEEKQEVFNRYKDIYTKYTQFESRYTKLIDKINEIANISGQLESIKNQIESLKKERKSLQEKALKTAKELQKFKKIYKTLELNPVIIDEFIRNNKEAVEFLTRRKEELLKKLTELETEGKQFKKEIKELENLEGVCPTCKRPIEEHSKEELLKDLKEKLQIKREEYKKLKEEIKKIEEKLSLEKSLPDYLESFKNTFEKYLDIEKQINQLKSKLFVLEKEVSQKEEIQKEKEQIEQFINENKENVQLFIEAKRSLEKEDIGKLKNLFKDIEKEKEKLKEDLKETSREAVEKRFEKLKEAEKRYISIKEQLKQKEKIKEKIEKYNKKINEIISKIKSIEKDIEEKPFTGEIEKYRQKQAQIQTEVQNLNEKLIKITEDLGFKEGELKNVLKEIEEHIKIENQIKKAENMLKKYEKIEFALGPKGIQKIIRENALYKLPKIVNIIFSSFDFPFSQIRFSDTFDISLLAPTVEREDRYVDINAISGGQRVALGVAMRIAISRFLSSKADFLILDEPTVHLDTQRRNDLINILIDLKEKNLVNQLILVTHDTEVEDAADTIYYVENGKVRLVS